MALQSTIRQRIIEMIDELPGELLPEIARFLEFLRFKTGHNGGRDSSRAESALIDTIHQELPSPDQRRLSHLRQKSENGELTEAEHAELLAYVERVESQDAKRAEALVQLAQLRKTPLETLVRDLALEPIASHAA